MVISPFLAVPITVIEIVDAAGTGTLMTKGMTGLFTLTGPPGVRYVRELMVELPVVLAEYETTPALTFR